MYPQIILKESATSPSSISLSPRDVRRCTWVEKTSTLLREIAPPAASVSSSPATSSSEDRTDNARGEGSGPRAHHGDGGVGAGGGAGAGGPSLIPTSPKVTLGSNGAPPVSTPTGSITVEVTLAKGPRRHRPDSGAAPSSTTVLQRPKHSGHDAPPELPCPLEAPISDALVMGGKEGAGVAASGHSEDSRTSKVVLLITPTPSQLRRQQRWKAVASSLCDAFDEFAASGTLAGSELTVTGTPVPLASSVVGSALAVGLQPEPIEVGSSNVIGAKNGRGSASQPSQQPPSTSTSTRLHVGGSGQGEGGGGVIVPPQVVVPATHVRHGYGGIKQQRRQGTGSPPSSPSSSSSSAASAPGPLMAGISFLRAPALLQQHLHQKQQQQQQQQAQPRALQPGLEVAVEQQPGTPVLHRTPLLLAGPPASAATATAAVVAAAPIAPVSNLTALLSNAYAAATGQSARVLRAGGEQGAAPWAGERAAGEVTTPCTVSQPLSTPLSSLISTAVRLAQLGSIGVQHVVVAAAAAAPTCESGALLTARSTASSAAGTSDHYEHASAAAAGRSSSHGHGAYSGSGEGGSSRNHLAPPPSSPSPSISEEAEVAQYLSRVLSWATGNKDSRGALTRRQLRHIVLSDNLTALAQSVANIAGRGVPGPDGLLVQPQEGAFPATTIAIAAAAAAATAGVGGGGSSTNRGCDGGVSGDEEDITSSPAPTTDVSRMTPASPKLSFTLSSPSSSAASAASTSASMFKVTALSSSLASKSQLKHRQQSQQGQQQYWQSQHEQQLQHERQQEQRQQQIDSQPGAGRLFSAGSGGVPPYVDTQSSYGRDSRGSVVSCRSKQSAISSGSSGAAYTPSPGNTAVSSAAVTVVAAITPSRRVTPASTSTTPTAASSAAVAPVAATATLSTGGLPAIRLSVGGEGVIARALLKAAREGMVVGTLASVSMVTPRLLQPPPHQHANVQMHTQAAARALPSPLSSATVSVQLPPPGPSQSELGGHLSIATPVSQRGRENDAEHDGPSSSSFSSSIPSAVTLESLLTLAAAATTASSSSPSSSQSQLSVRAAGAASAMDVEEENPYTPGFQASSGAVPVTTAAASRTHVHTPASGNGAVGSPTPRHLVAAGAAVTVPLRADADLSRAAVAAVGGGKDEDGGDKGGGDGGRGENNEVASSAHAVSGFYREGGSTRSHSIATSGSSAESDGGAHYRDDGNVSGNTSTHAAATGMGASYPGGDEPLPFPPLAYQQAMMFQQQEQFQHYMQYQLQQHQQLQHQQQSQPHQELDPADYHHRKGLYAMQQQQQQQQQLLQQQQLEFQLRQVQLFIASGGVHSLQFLPPQPPYNAQYPAVFGSPSPGPPLPAGQVPIPIPVPMVMQLRVGGGGGSPSAHMRGTAASGSGGSSGGVRYTDDGRSSAGADSREGLTTPSAVASNAYGSTGSGGFDSSPIVYNVNNYRYSRGGDAAGGGRGGVNMVPPSSSSSVNNNPPSAAPRYRNSAIGVVVGASVVGSVNGSSYSRPSTSHQQ